MVEIGKIQKLKVANIAKIGVYLDAGTEEQGDNILLPNNQLPDDVKEGDELEVFVYRDSEDRLIATRKTPLVQAGEIAVLKVKETTSIGAFLDIGLERDVLLPFKEQKYRVISGKKYLVAIYIDKSDRLTATTYISKFLSSESPYKKDEWVKGIVYSINNEIGALVAVDNKYKGLIPKSELYKEINVGDEVECRVARVRDDGKLDLGTREVAYKQMDSDVEMLLNKLEKYDGFIPLNDKSKPEEIKDRLKISKAAFKRAVGRLLKEDKIIQTEKGIKLK
ncbi:S1 RNA-binding domain-containing protein [Clostridium botulinum C]|uniref:S1 RNA-binding domain-containing protein n=3 Tax=Clostridium botulinum TaxID=1491 RepID=A0A9Q4TG23_CLOBO|nr:MULTISPECIES: S1-like domain-containing RNA-binding protein [Clostridium]EGO87502.1 RNA-binding protein [Clostridium botulinum C str. Stockholm]EES90424.1 S1 RNA binding domain protein [Clostridium botulinum D str. 1873]MBO3442459.1 S1 RNA-binding domain-containing protein [Clostridium haemolyticum]MCD3195656.1 S1 RNA-binding domain-containing protein [Clostridium botulinum C]MCD3201071.1 S1 RNA-binding domain-containing protein [Clostridium botulinum C]